MARRGSRGTAGVAVAPLLAGFALLVLAWLGPGTAPATFPGENGKIAFAGDGVIRAVNPDGTAETFLTCPLGEVMDRPWYSGEGGLWVGAPTWSPDGRRIAFTRTVPGGGPAAGEIPYLVILNPGGTEDKVGGDAGSPTWSPDGERIAFSVFEWPDGPNFVRVSNRDGSDRTTLAEEAHSPVWSPDGERIAFVRFTSGWPDIWVMNADGSDPTLLAEQGDSPAWSPDSQRIAFVRGGAIWVMDADGSGQTLLAEQAVSPTWSPAGNRIAFGREGGIWTMNVDGSDPRRLAEGDRAIWSPDSQRIAFARGGAIWVMDADGSGQARVAEGPGGRIDWQAITPGAEGNPGPGQFCFTGLRRNTDRGIARLVVEVSGPGRVILRQAPGVRRFSQVHHEAGAGRVVLRVRPRGRALRELKNPTSRFPVRAQVTYRPSEGEPRTRSGRIWLVRAPRRCRPVNNRRVRVIRIGGTLGCKRIRRLAARTVYKNNYVAKGGFFCDWSHRSGTKVKVKGRTYTKGFCRKSGLRVSFLGLRKKTDLWARGFTSTAVTEDGEPWPLVPGTRIRMYFWLFDAVAGTGNVIWSAGCPQRRTYVRVTTTRIRFDPIRRDLWGECGVGHQRQSNWLSDFFESSPRWRLRDRQLVLRSTGIVIRLRAGRG